MRTYIINMCLKDIKYPSAKVPTYIGKFIEDKSFTSLVWQ